MRREGFVRLKRRIMQRHRDLLAEGFSSSSNSVPFDPNMPWNSVFDWATRDEYWKDEVFTPCIQVGAKIKNPSRFVQGDAPIVAHPPPPRPHPVGRDQTPKLTKAQQKRDRQAQRPDPPQPPKKTPPPPTPKTEQDPTICQNFNRGKCTLNAEGVCPNDPARRHICNICGKANHPATKCNDPRAKDGNKKRKK